MKAVFGEVTAEESASYGVSSIVAKNGDGDTRHFHFFVEYGSNAGGMDEFGIGDSVGRFVPVPVEELDTLIEILEDLKASVEVLEVAESLYEDVMDAKNITIY